VGRTVKQLRIVRGRTARYYFAISNHHRLRGRGVLRTNLPIQIARFFERLAAIALTLALTCGTAFAQTSGDAAAAPDAQTSAQNSIKLVGVIVALPAGTPWLSLARNLIYCSDPLVQTWTGGRAPQDLPPYSAIFKTELEKANYKVVTPGQDNLFDPESSAADYEAAAVITDEHINGCPNGGGLFSSSNRGDVQGDGTMKIDWQIYSPIKKQVVARVSTSGSAKLDKPVPGGLQRLIIEAFSANARELADSPDFRTAMIAPKALTKGFVIPGQQSKIALAGSLKAKGRPIADAVGSVVTLITGEGSGSGVLVSSDGFILTNAHVVGDAKEIRVRWSDGIETTAQVVRASKDRDVAIVSTISRDRTPLAIKRGAVTPGQRVYAIGSPKGSTFQGTVSSGIVSASDRIMNGLRYIQSDTTVSFGSSGGALLDETGSLIGITDLGIPNEGLPAGLNLFIPIGDAMDFLSLEQQ
jgi:serine protease Do